MRGGLHDAALAIPLHESGRRCLAKGTNKFAGLDGLNTEMLQHIEEVQVILSGEQGIYIFCEGFWFFGVIGLIGEVCGRSCWSRWRESCWKRPMLSTCAPISFGCC